MKTIKNIFLFLIVFSLTFLAGNIFARADSLSPEVIDATGGRSSGGSYILESSMGQFDSGISTGGTYQLNSGYEQPLAAVGTYINISVNPSGGVTMGDISGFMSGQISSGSSDIKVTTDYSGYSLAIKASTNPAFKCDTSSGCDVSDSFADYSPAGGVGNPDYYWSAIDTVSEFGYTAKGTDILAKFKYDSGNSSCGSGATDVTGSYCWDALTTTDANIASSNSSNSPSGTTTTVKFRSQIGTNKLQPSGTYKAGITVTATAGS